MQDVMPSMTPTQQKIMEMLGRGYPRVTVADTVGVTEGYISQLLSEEWFAQEVQRRKFAQSQKLTQLDDKYDSLEEKLLAKLDKASALLIKPLDIARVLTAVNGAKRKGVQNQDPATLVQTVVQLNMPIQLMQKFVKDSNNQVVEIQHGQESPRALVTIPGGALEELSRKACEDKFAAGQPGISNLGSSGGNSAEGIGAQSGETIRPQSLERLAEVAAAQARLSQGIPRTQKVTAEDI